MNILKNIFKIGFIKNILSPKLVTVTFQGKDQPALLYIPYGMFFKPSKKSVAGILADQGNESSLMAMVTDIENREALEDDEVAYGIPSLKSRIFFRKDGNINFKIEDQEGGDYAARFLELKAGFDELVQAHNDLVTAHNTHTHITTATVGPTPVPGVIAPTTSVEIPSTANIDDAKIDEIELPSI